MAGAYPGGYAEGYGSATATLVPFLAIEFDPDVWTDVSADVVNLATRRGRNRESGAFEPGTISVTLRNDDRRYDPDHVTGPWYGKLRPSRRVRLTATWLFEYPVILASIDRITQAWGGPNDATAVFDCTDAFKDLNRVELPTSVYVAEKQALTPDLWWPLDEPSGSTTVADIGTSKVPGTVIAGTTLGAAGLVVRDPGSAMGVVGTLTTGQGFVVEKNSNPGASISGTGPFTVEGWFQAAAQTDDGTIYFQWTAGPGIYLWIKVRGAGAFVGLLQFNIGLVNAVQSSIRVDDGAVHHFAATRAADGTMALWIDGLDRTAAAVVDANDVPAGDIYVGNASYQGGLTGTIQHLGVWRSYRMPLAVAETLNNAGRTPWRGQSSGTRLLKILTLAGVAPTDQNVQAGSTTLQSTDLGGSALAYAQKVEETENGWLFVDRYGRVTFVSRQNGLTGNYLIPRNQFADADSGAVSPPNVVPYRTASADVDEATLVTRATVSRAGSVAVTVGDTAAQAEFGIIDETHDGLLHDSDAFSKQYAEWVLNTHRSPSSRVGAIEVTPEADPAGLWPFVLGLELADPVTFKRKPQNTGAVITKSMRVESISHFVSGAGWVVAYQLSPFNLAGEGLPVFTWDVTRWDQHVWGF